MGEPFKISHWGIKQTTFTKESGDTINYSIYGESRESLSDLEYLKKQWAQPGEILVYHNVVIHEEEYDPKPYVYAKHHRTCHLRHGGEECTC